MEIDKVSELLEIPALFKEVKRAGWNKEFPPDARCKTRVTQNAESVPDHSFALAILSWYMATTLGLNVSRVVLISLIHDLPETFCGDGVTAHEVGNDKITKERERKAREDATMNEICSTLGNFGQTLANLWQEYREQKTPEARLVHELDGIEMVSQSIRYQRTGQQVDPREFIETTESRIKNPVLMQLLEYLKESSQ